MWTEAIMTSPSLWWTWLGPMTLQEMTVPVAPGPPAMFVFLKKAVKNHVRDGLDWCYSSIFPCQQFYCCDPECQKAVNLCTSYWKSLGHLMIYHLNRQWVQYFFFGNSPSLAVCHILWCSVCLISTTFILSALLIPLGRNLSTAFDPIYIFMSFRWPQCSMQGPTAGLKPVLWSRAMAGLNG